MTDTEKVREAIRLLEENLAMTIWRSDGGTIRRVYLILTGGKEYKWPAMQKPASGIKEKVTSKMIEKRFGIKV